MTHVQAGGAPPLGKALQEALRGFDKRAALARDPLAAVRAVVPAEREVVAHITACLAYGAVDAIRAAVAQVLAVLGPSPTEGLLRWQHGTFTMHRPDFVYRMTRAEDIDALLQALSVQLKRHGSLERAFAVAGGGEPALQRARDSRLPLTAWVHALRAAMPPGAGRGARYLTPDPATGSATKRWHLLLRWLVRPDDGVDLGLWTVLRPGQLVLPLDTHTARLVQSLGLTARRTVDYRMAREATDALQRVDAEDPVRFDMPLCHMGISKQCLHRWEPTICPACPLRGACRWTHGRTV